MAPYNAGDDPEDDRRGWVCQKCGRSCEAHLENFDIGPDPVAQIESLRWTTTPDLHLGGEVDD